MSKKKWRVPVWREITVIQTGYTIVEADTAEEARDGLLGCVKDFTPEWAELGDTTSCGPTEADTDSAIYEVD